MICLSTYKTTIKRAGFIMITGHFAAGLALKPKETAFSETIPLWILFFAAQLTDVVGMIFVILGWEYMEPAPGISAMNSMEMYLPYTHSLIMTPVWMLAGALAYKLVYRDATRRNMIIVAIGVASHWILDFISHVPDLPIWLSREPVVGLGLWNSIIGTMAVETLLLAVGIRIFLKAGTVKSRVNKMSFCILCVFLFVLAVASENVGLPDNGHDKAVTALVLFVGVQALALLSEWPSKASRG